MNQVYFILSQYIMTCWRYLQCKRKEGSEGGKKERWKIGGRGKNRRPGDTQNDARIRLQNQLGGDPVTTVPECQPWPQHHCHPLPEYSLCGPPSLDLCVASSQSHSGIPGYISHSRCLRGAGGEGGSLHFTFSMERWSLMHNVEVSIGQEEEWRFK